jgi:futalosine hydrolase
VSKILIVAATSFELEGVVNYFKIKNIGESGLSNHPINSKINLSILITGIGMVNTAYYMGKHVSNEFDYLINVGVCGAINRNLQLGDVVHVVTDTISELGAEDGEDFIHYPDLNLGGTNVYKTNIDDDYKFLAHLKKTNGITVNTVHGNEVNIKKLTDRYSLAEVESMEGAAFFRGCDGIHKPCFQIRAVSNYVERRDKSNWNMSLAITQLNKVLIGFINDVSA